MANVQNCWEYNQCGREPEGAKAAELGVCPATGDSSFSGINRGTNGGRICWAIAGTFCGGEVQGSFAEKRGSCTRCDFFRLVQSEEGAPDSHSKFLKFISEQDRSPIFSHMSYRRVKAGERFIAQGEVEDVAYIIQRGSCLVIVEKDGELHPADHYGEGDIVGGLGILTGEPRQAHVEAETDMELWVLRKEHFDQVSEQDPLLRNFLTELVANRFDSKRPTAYRTIGKYIATDIIGRGGYSVVYKGVHIGLNMPVAIKMMRHNLAMDPDFLANFHREATTIASLNHENIVRIYDIEERYRTVFIIMELVEGESLSEMVKRLRVIPPSLAVDFILQTCSGLEYAHKRGIIHRDINSDNIFLLPGDNVKILDFGLACPIGTEDVNLSGTIAYMAPEQIQGEAVDQRTDIYALGVTAHEMLTGRRPFPEEDLPALVQMHLTQDIPDPGEIVPGLPEALRGFIMKAARRDAGERYENVGQILRDLQPLAEEYGILGKHPIQEKRRMTSLFLVFEDQHQLKLSELIDEFSSKVQGLGAVLRISDVHDI